MTPHRWSLPSQPADSGTECGKACPWGDCGAARGHWRGQRGVRHARPGQGADPVLPMQQPQHALPCWLVGPEPASLHTGCQPPQEEQGRPAAGPWEPVGIHILD